METRPVTTPGFLGYVLMYGLAVVFFAVPVGLLEGGVEGEFSAAGMVVLVALFTACMGLPLGLLLIPLLEMLAQPYESQGAHVALAWLFGVVGCTATILVLMPPSSGVTELAWAMRTVFLGGLATGGARAAVIPLVRTRAERQRRRRARASAAVPSQSSIASESQ